MKKVISALVVVFFFLCFISCTTVPPVKKAILTEEPERMFWRLSSFDSNARPAVVYIQGTIHVGDDRLYPVADSVLAAWKSADRLAGEISTEGWGFFPAGTAETYDAKLYRCSRAFCL